MHPESAMSLHLTGIHHLTAITATAVENKRFYTETLGLRLVKKTVNQDDTSAYHLFYADAQGSPGTDITFFDWPAPPEVRGTNSIVQTAFRVANEDSLRWWDDYLSELGIKHGAIEERDGRLTIDFDDFEGQRLCLVDDGGAGEACPWDKSPVPMEHQIRGLGPITLSVPAISGTEKVLTEVMGMRRVRDYGDAARPVHVYEMGEGGPAAELHVAVEPDLPPQRMGAGGVHHVAFRTPDEDSYNAWIEQLRAKRVASSGPVDRFYFRSLYFREPNGILFEIATDGPGFASDEPAESLGEKLALPPFLEPRRAAIEAKLKPL
jgi:glyoxalase family protein